MKVSDGLQCQIIFCTYDEYRDVPLAHDENWEIDGFSSDSACDLRREKEKKKKERKFYDKKKTKVRR